MDLLESALPKALEKILATSVRVISDSVQEALEQPPFTAMASLNSQKLTLINAYEDQQKPAFSRLMKPIQRETRRGVIGEVQRSFENLKLVDKEELTLKLLSDHFIEQLDDSVNTKLALLAMRFEYLCAQDLEIDELPISHTLLSEHLLSAIKTLKLEPDVRGAFFKLLLTRVADHYVELVNQANNLFIDAGVLADLNDSDGQSRFKRNQQKIAAVKKRKALIASVSHEVKFDDDGNPIPPEMEEVLEHLNIPDTAKGHTIDSDMMAPPMSQTELLASVDKLGELHSTPIEEGTYQKQSQQTSLASQLGDNVGLNEYSLDNKNANTISMMSMLFEDLFANTHFAEPIKALLEQLQVPMLKTAILDKKFFADSGNPAQVLLDKIAEHGASWTPDKAPEKDFFYKNMAAIVRQVNANFDGTYSVFTDAVHAFDTFNKKHQERTAKIEQRIVSMEKARARHDRANTESAAHIRQIFDRFVLPEPLDAFVHSAWQNVLFFIHNKYDNKDNHQWQAATMAEIKLMRILAGMKQDKKDAVYDLQAQMLEVGQQKGEVNLALKTILPSLTKTERRAPAKAQPEQPSTSLLNDTPPVQSASAAADTSSTQTTAPVTATATPATPAPPEPLTPLVEEEPMEIVEPAASAISDRINDSLADQGSVSLFEDGLLDETPSLLSEPVVAATADVAVTDNGIPDNLTIHSESDIRALHDQLSVGSWLLDNRQAEPEKIKVAAYIRHTDHYILVRRNGTKAASPTSEEMLTLLKTAQLELIESALAFDRALESVITGLRA